MVPEIVFTYTSILAMAGWLTLLLSPLMPVLSDRIAGFAIPVVLSIVYTILVLMSGMGEGGYGDLAAVSLLFNQPEGVLAGWLHFLAFDLWIGAWICRTARRQGIRFWSVVPCLVVTFGFGPAGFLAFSAVRAARGLA